MHLRNINGDDGNCRSCPGPMLWFLAGTVTWAPHHVSWRVLQRSIVRTAVKRLCLSHQVSWRVLQRSIARKAVKRLFALSAVSVKMVQFLVFVDFAVKRPDVLLVFLVPALFLRLLLVQFGASMMSFRPFLTRRSLVGFVSCPHPTTLMRKTTMRKTLAPCILFRPPWNLRARSPQWILSPHLDLLFRSRVPSTVPRPLHPKARSPNIFLLEPTFFKELRLTRLGSRDRDLTLVPLYAPQAGPVPTHTRPLSPSLDPQLPAPGRSVPSGYVPPVTPCPSPLPNPLAQLPLPPPRPRPLSRFKPSLTFPQLARLQPSYPSFRPSRHPLDHFQRRFPLHFAHVPCPGCPLHSVTQGPPVHVFTSPLNQPLVPSFTPGPGHASYPHICHPAWASLPSPQNWWVFPAPSIDLTF